MEFYCDGTAIRKIAPDAKPVTPTVVVSVD
jgi:hypothetical protein